MQTHRPCYRITIVAQGVFVVLLRCAGHCEARRACIVFANYHPMCECGKRAVWLGFELKRQLKLPNIRSTGTAGPITESSVAHYATWHGGIATSQPPWLSRSQYGTRYTAGLTANSSWNEAAPASAGQPRSPNGTQPAGGAGLCLVGIVRCLLDLYYKFN